MAIETVDVVVKAPKELNEALSALENVVLDLKAGKSVAEIAATRFAEFLKAVDGIQKVPAEVKEAAFDCVAAGAVHGVRVVKALLS